MVIKHGSSISSSAGALVLRTLLWRVVLHCCLVGAVCSIVVVCDPSRDTIPANRGNNHTHAGLVVGGGVVGVNFTYFLV